MTNGHPITTPLLISSCSIVCDCHLAEKYQQSANLGTGVRALSMHSPGAFHLRTLLHLCSVGPEGR